MMTQSVMTQAANLFASAPGSVTLKGKQKGNDFSLLIGDSLKEAQNAASMKNAAAAQQTSNQTTTQSNTKSDSLTKDDTQTKSAQTDNSVNTTTANVSDQKVSDQQTDSSKTQGKETSKTDEKDDSKVDDQVLAQIQALLQTIGQAVMDKLNLSQEQFNQLLTSQGLSLTDLLQPENLQQLVLANSGNNDLLSVLTDENLADTMKQLLQTVQGIKEDSKLGLSAEQMKSLIEQAQAQAEAQKGTEDAVNPVVTESQKDATSETVNQSIYKSNEKTSDNNTSNTDSNTEMTSNSKAETSATAEKSGTTSDSNSDRKSDREAKNDDRFQTFVDNLMNSTQNVQTQFSGGTTQVANLREIANQIIEHIKVSVSTDQTSMELQLNPENLGKVNLSVQSKNGVLTAHFVVQNEVSKEAIESQIQTLRDTLHQQGVKVEAIEVTVSTNAFEQNPNQSSESGSEAKDSNNGRKITLEDALNMTDAEQVSESQEDLSGISGNVINYTA